MHGQTRTRYMKPAPPPPLKSTKVQGLTQQWSTQLLLSPAGAMFGARDDGEGAARRRRERRLRSWLKHERQSVAMGLSEYKHHSSRGQRKDRAGEEGHRVKCEAPRRQTPPPPQGSRPPCLGEPRGPQARVQKHTKEQLAVVVAMVQILDIPVPQMVEQLVDVLRFFDTLCPVPEQVNEVPKILLDDILVCMAVRVPQLAEQPVEVPTIVSNFSLQRTMEQRVDIPVPGREGRISGLQGFPPGQSSTAPMAQIVANPAPGGGLQDFRPGQSSSASSSSSWCS